MKQPLAWDLGLEDETKVRAEKADAEIRISDCFLFALIPFVGVRVEVVGAPFNELVALAILMLAAFRRPPPGSRVPLTVILALAGIVGLMTVSGVLNDIPIVQRVGHLVIYSGLVLALGSGRISLPSAALGLGLGLMAVSVMAFAGIGGRWYGDRLTGFFRDPNVAAFFLSTLGCIVVGYVRSRTLRVLFALGLGTALLLTYSRTGLLAFGMIAVWVLVGRRLGVKGGLALVAGLVWITANLPDSLRLIGPFSDRDGSDALRDRIIDEEHRILDLAPWYGRGPGTSYVDIGIDSFFFHSSYLSTVNEGGWLLLGLVLALMAYCFIKLVPAARRGDARAIGSQASFIAMLAMAVTLGEVFLELPAALALGFALRTITTTAPTRIRPDG